jgi:regulator of RNase E activity RraA
VFGKAAVPVTARGRVAEHAFNQPITVAGIAVSPGDWVMGDGSGIVFLPQADAETILAVAEDIFRREQAMARDIDAGVPIDQVMGANYEDMLKKDG